ncbi:MAG: VIT domain-containing protein, partial [Solimonas sp.]
MRVRLFYFMSFVLLLFLIPGLGRAAEATDLGGSLQAEVDGRVVVLPSLKTDIDADIAGDLATVTVTQTFANPGRQALNATYLFPLNHDAAVFEMTMEVGDERLRAQIAEKRQAEQ